MDVRIPVRAHQQRCHGTFLRRESQRPRHHERPEPQSAGSKVLLVGKCIGRSGSQSLLRPHYRQRLWLDGATVSRGQLLRPYPEFCNVNENLIPAGDGRYNALDFNYTHRVSQGLTLLASYTFSKFLDNVGGPTTWANTSGNFSENFRNVYNLAAEKSVDPNDITHAFVLSYVYELPVGKGRKLGSGMNSVLNAVVGGWQTSGIATFKGGFPLRINTPNLNRSE